MTREERLERALHRALGEADYICTGPIPHGDCWACEALAALAAPAAPPPAAAPRDDEHCVCGHPLAKHRHPLAMTMMISLSKAMERHCRAIGCRCDAFRRRAPRPSPAAPASEPAAGVGTCGHIDEGWESFPCTLPMDHDGDHAWTGRASLRSMRAPSRPGAPACPACGGRGEPVRPPGHEAVCIACGGTGRAPKPEPAEGSVKP